MLSIAEPPLAPLVGVTSLSVRVSGSLESSEWDTPSPGGQLSWGSPPCECAALRPRRSKGQTTGGLRDPPVGRLRTFTSRPNLLESNTATEVAATAKQIDVVSLRRRIAAPTSPLGNYPSRSGVATDCRNQSVRAVVSRRPSRGGSALNVTQRQIPGLPPGATVPR